MAGPSLSTISCFFARERRISQKARAAIIVQPATGPITAPAIQALFPELPEPCELSREEVAFGVGAVADVAGAAEASVHCSWSVSSTSS